ncbi:protein CcmA, bactofilin family [Paenibacillus sp. 1_12]|uniref:polymer-forming cytoskeletal protein n=1 Tax=Paenibacillus sp. 1_12 TaxID=1566278 RepID=UPI0008EDC934|nr:polymer-forming cytoskeletal protein [Paenibacillus sp. 1_12]SFM23031.1 protein CcmA, bactofilin family [Paenibacillus sp. 1_12]
MDTQSKRNLTLSGIGSSNGGTVRVAKIDGIGKVNGDINCSDFIVNGKANVLGGVQASTAEINGTAVVEGDLHAERIRIQGKLIVQGNLVGDHIQLNGMASVKDGCESEIFNANGRLQIGALNAGNIQITLHGHSQIAEIGGEQIKIRKQPGIDYAKWLKLIPIPVGSKLTAQTIEGDTIYVEYTTAEAVRGTDVVIGPGCEIGLVEYKGKFEQDKGSKVERLEQL